MMKKLNQVNDYLKEGRPWTYTAYIVLLIVVGFVVNFIRDGHFKANEGYSFQLLLIFLVWLTYYLTKKGMKVVYQWLISWVLLTVVGTAVSLYDKSIIDYTGVIIIALIALLTSLLPLWMAKSYYKQLDKEIESRT